MKIKDLINESNFADLGLKGLGSELDKDDEFGADFKAPRMFQQLAKCADNIKGQAELKTDDGKTIMCKSATAKRIMDMERNMTNQGGKKEKFMRMIQNSDGLQKAIDFVEKN